MCRFWLRCTSVILLAFPLAMGSVPKLNVSFAAAVPSGSVFVGTPVDLISSLRVTSPADLDLKALTGFSGFSSRIDWRASEGTVLTPAGLGARGTSTRSPGGIVFAGIVTYVPPDTPGTYTITATPAADPAKSVRLEIVVQELRLKLMPTSVTLNPGQVQQFGISIHGPNAALLQWSASGGTINAQGVYTAPTVAGTYTVTVRQPTSGRQASALITVEAASGAGIRPAVVDMVPRQSMQFLSTLDPMVSTWSVQESQGGFITDNGTYTAPLKTGTYTIQLQNAAKPAERAMATVHVVPLTIHIKPEDVNLGTNQVTQFYAEANGGTWIWGASGGTISDSGLFQAPMEVGTYQITAQSTLDPSIQATASAHVMGPVILSVVPEDITLRPGQSCTFTTVGLSSGAQASWFVEPASAGTITEDGVFTAGNHPELCSVMVVGDEMGASASVRIEEVKILPDPAAVVPGGTLQLSATGFPSDAKITWSVRPAPAGTISSDGLFTASARSGSVTVSASAKDTEATARVKILGAKISPDPALVLPGSPVRFTCDVFEASGPTVTWALLGDQPGASIGPGGDYVAPNRQGIYHVSAATAGGSTAQATVIVGPPDALVVAPEIEVRQNRIYQVKVRLRASNGRTIDSHWVGELKEGIAYPEVSFLAGSFRQVVEVDGPYAIDQIIVAGYVGDEVVEFDRRENVGFTVPFSLSESWKDWITIGEISDIRGVDQSGSGLIDKLAVTVSVEVLVEGDYRIRASLANSAGKVIDSFGDTQTWKRGTHALSLTFDGRKIRASGVSGPLSITDLTLEGTVTRSKEFPNSIQGYDFRMFKP
jgi:hypothetical protein